MRPSSPASIATQSLRAVPSAQTEQFHGTVLIEPMPWGLGSPHAIAKWHACEAPLTHALRQTGRGTLSPSVTLM